MCGEAEGRGWLSRGWMAKQRDGWLSTGMGGKNEKWEVVDKDW
jgi:hypothetical protein